nr:MAG TPA: hypothetical protein [Caudoviricetes sp.]
MPPITLITKKNRKFFYIPSFYSYFYIYYTLGLFARNPSLTPFC